MARMPRKHVVDEDEVGVYHCINRCVRRAFLCGTDTVTGQCFDHRKLWIQKRLEYLAGQFGIDVLAFAVMSNHLHVVLRNRRKLEAYATSIRTVVQGRSLLVQEHFYRRQKRKSCCSGVIGVSNKTNLQRAICGDAFEGPDHGSLSSTRCGDGVEILDHRLALNLNIEGSLADCRAL